MRALAAVALLAGCGDNDACAVSQDPKGLLILRETD